MPQILKLLRQKRGPAVAVEAFEGFGAVLRPADDPEGITIPEDAYKAIRLDADFPVIPKELIARVVSLYIWLMEKRPGGNGGGPDTAREVSVVFLRDAETMKRWRVLVPRQVVGSASVEADFTRGLCDIETGEEITVWPPEGWLHAGSSHSHNSMRAFFSGTDDRSELPVPGVHFVCGNFRKTNEQWGYEIAPSIVYKRVRYEKIVSGATVRDMEWKDILDASANESKHHDKVLEYVTIQPPTNWNTDAFRTHVGKFDIDDDYSGFGYGLYGPGSFYGERERADIERYYRARERWERDRDIPAVKGLRRVCVIPVTGVVYAGALDVLRDHIRMFRAWVQAEYGSPVLEERPVYVMQGESLWVPQWKHGLSPGDPRPEGGNLDYMRVNEIDDLTSVKKHAKKQRQFERRAAQQAEPLPVVLPLVHGVPAEQFAKDFTEEEIVALCISWGRSVEKRTALRIGFGKAVSKANIELDDPKISER